MPPTQVPTPGIFQETTLERGLPLQIQLEQYHPHQRMKIQPGSLAGFVSPSRLRDKPLKTAMQAQTWLQKKRQPTKACTKHIINSLQSKRNHMNHLFS